MDIWGWIGFWGGLGGIFLTLAQNTKIARESYEISINAISYGASIIDEKIFGRYLFSLRSLLVSLLASFVFLLAARLFLIFEGEGIYNSTFIPSDTNRYVQFLYIHFVLFGVNAIPDFFSVVCTRYVIKFLSNREIGYFFSVFVFTTDILINILFIFVTISFVMIINLSFMFSTGFDYMGTLVNYARGELIFASAITSFLTSIWFWIYIFISYIAYILKKLYPVLLIRKVNLPIAFLCFFVAIFGWPLVLIVDQFI